MLAPLGFVLLLSFRVYKMSVGATQLTFWVFAAVMGVSLSSIFLVFTGQSIAQVFFVTAAAFAGLSLYGYTTKTDLSGWGSFLIMGVIGIIIAALVNIFLQSSALQFAISVIGVLIFAGLTAYDTQRIKDDYYQIAGDATADGQGRDHGCAEPVPRLHQHVHARCCRCSATASKPSPLGRCWTNREGSAARWGPLLFASSVAPRRAALH